MNPIEPITPTAPGWSESVYAKDQKDDGYLPLPSVRNLTDRMVPVISIWELNPGDVALMKAMIASHEAGGPAPRISLELSTFGDPLQPIRLTVGEFAEPYVAAANDGGEDMHDKNGRLIEKGDWVRYAHAEGDNRDARVIQTFPDAASCNVEVVTASKHLNAADVEVVQKSDGAKVEAPSSVGQADGDHGTSEPAPAAAAAE
jgi:hypothetical protein